MRRLYWVSLTGCAALTAAAFLPWLRLGDVGLSGIPDPAGFFVLGVGVVGLLLSIGGLATRRNTQPALFLAGVAGVTTLVLVWMTGPDTIAGRAQARAEALALVDNVAVQAPPPVRVGSGVYVGLAGAAVIAAVGAMGTLRHDV